MLVLKDIINSIQIHAQVDAIYLYGLREKHTEHPKSDWDIAVLFTDYEKNILKRLLKPQLLEAAVERELKQYNQLSIVNLESVPIYLQMGIITTGIKYFDANVPHIKRLENSILSTWEKDYERYCL